MHFVYLLSFYRESSFSPPTENVLDTLNGDISQGAHLH